MIITIETTGYVSYIGDLPIELPLANPVRRRVSTIRPVRFLKRMAFVILRTVFGETGRVAAFTRTWAGPWKAVILATGESFVADSRQACIDWELEKFNPPLFPL